MMRRHGAALVVFAAACGGVGALAADSSPSAACSCRHYASDGDEIMADMDRAVAIFAGEVVSVRSPKATQSRACQGTPPGEWVQDCDDLEIKFHVLHAWRGVQARVVRVWPPRGGGSCRYRFEVGSSYLVYATTLETSDALRVWSCSRTRMLYEADVDRQYLGEPNFVPQ